MNAVAQAFVVVAALVHVWVWVCESFLFHRPGVHRDIFKTPTEHVPALRLWTYCQGFYSSPPDCSPGSSRSGSVTTRSGSG